MGLDKLLTVLIQVKAQVPDVWLAIAGKGPLTRSLHKILNNQNQTIR